MSHLTPLDPATASYGAICPPGSVRWAARLSLAAAVLLAGCSVLKEKTIDYRSSSDPGVSLEVPPDLTQLSRDSRYTMVGGVVNASDLQTGKAVATPTPTPTATNDMANVRIERAGNVRWLAVPQTPDKLWGRAVDFWRDNGFVLTLSDPALGIMETDWAENRAKLPQDLVRRTIGKLFEDVYSTGERDKFRTRLERNAKGGTDIYISHRGMVETYTSAQKDRTVWQPRAADVELETEFLRRLMVKLGMSQEKAQTIAQTDTPAQAVASMSTQGQNPAIEIPENFDRAWRRVGLSLDRTGFTIEDRNRAQGLYFVRYVPEQDSTPAKEPGFLARWFSSSGSKATPIKYQIRVLAEKAEAEAETTTIVSVLDAQGQPDASAAARRILELLAQDLK